MSTSTLLFPRATLRTLLRGPILNPRLTSSFRPAYPSLAGPTYRALSTSPHRYDAASSSSSSSPFPSLAAPDSDTCADSISKRGKTEATTESGIKVTWRPDDESKAGQPLKIEQEPKLSLTFTCTALIDPSNPTSAPTPPSSSPASTVTPKPEPVEDTPCGHRSTHQFSKQAYTKGIVLVQCPQCQNRHLIADHLGWFPEITEGGQKGQALRTIEDMMREKGEKVVRGNLKGGDMEIY